MKTQTHKILLTATALLVIAGCGGDDSQSTASQAPAAPETDLSRLFLAEAPAEPVTVAELAAAPQPGAAIAVSGQIGGTVEPFGKGYAVFFLADESLMFCDEMGDDDHCPTPWDACCEDPDKVAANRVLVRFSGEDGEILPVSLKGARGLAGLDRVTVAGTVQTAEGGGTVIEATGIYRNPNR